MLTHQSNIRILNSDNDFKSLQSEFNLFLPIEELSSVLYHKHFVQVLDRRDSLDAIYSESDAQHDFDFLNEDAVLGDILE